MIFRRTLHPVGHGAFFTEHLKTVDSKAREKAFFNVVYDCGATARGQNVSSLVKKEIDITFEKDEHIDILFISHFDEDHTNGLVYLLENTKMDEDTCVVIPFRFPYILMVLDTSYPSLARFIDGARQKGVRFVGIHGEGLGPMPDGDKREENNGKVLQIDKNNLFTAWDVENKQPLWYFYPFMNVNVGSLQQVFERAISDDEKLKGVNLDDPKVVIAHRDDLKKIYKGIGKSKNNVTKINVNSLLMLSFPARIDIKECYSRVGHESGFDMDPRMMPGAYADCGITCLYTGDSVVDNAGMDKIDRHAVSVMKNLSGFEMIHLFQIPHHGSDHSFSPNFFAALDRKVIATFVNGNPYRRWCRGYRDLTREATGYRIPFYVVSQSYHSRIETVVEM